MSFLSFIARVVAGVVMQQGVRDIFSDVGRYAVRQSTAAIVRHIRTQSAKRRGIPTIK